MLKKILLALLMVGIGANAEFVNGVFVKDRFTRIDKKNVVIDHKTKLMWADDKNSQKLKKSWNGAVKYCKNLHLGGFTNWRLPKLDELYYITDKRRTKPSSYPIFKNVRIDAYWTYSTVPKHKDGAYYIYFYHGKKFWYDKTWKNCVRCVRNIN